MFKRFLICTICFLISAISSYAQEEKITITTYYPSPYGSYRELRSQRMAIGDTYINHSDVCWEGDTGCSGSPMIPSANDVDLIVEGNVGIGTTTPGAMLQIGDTGFNNGSYNLRVTKGSAAGAFDGSYATELRSYTGGSGSMGVLIHHQETVANRHILDISNANGIVASFNGNGNVGIGTTGPGSRLHLVDAGVAGVTSPVLSIRQDDEIGYGLIIGNDEEDPLIYRGMKLRIDDNGKSIIETYIAGAYKDLLLNPSGGNVGIGTTNPGTNKLKIEGGATETAGGLIIERRTSDPTSPATGQMWLRTNI